MALSGEEVSKIEQREIIYREAKKTLAPLSPPFFTCGFSLRVFCSAVFLLSSAFLSQPLLFLFPFSARCINEFGGVRPLFVPPLWVLFVSSFSLPLALLSCSSSVLPLFVLAPSCLVCFLAILLVVPLIPPLLLLFVLLLLFLLLLVLLLLRCFFRLIFLLILLLCFYYSYSSSSSSSSSSPPPS